MWQSGIHLLAGDWAAAESAALRIARRLRRHHLRCLRNIVSLPRQDPTRDPDLALDLATRHPDRNRDISFGNLLGIAAAIARIQRGDTDRGLAEIAEIQDRARQTPFAVHQDDAAIAIAYIAHLLDQDDLAVQILETGVIGYGPWIGYLVPRMCRDHRHPGHRALQQNRRGTSKQSDHYGTTASSCAERTQSTASPARDRARPQYVSFQSACCGCLQSRCGPCRPNDVLTSRDFPAAHA